MTALTPGQRLARAELLHLLQTPGLWPHWPILPVIRRTTDSSDVECGVLFDARGCANLYGYSSTVFIANLFALPTTVNELLACPREVFDTAEELADHGWTVD
jgi:hypothetical protein